MARKRKTTVRRKTPVRRKTYKRTTTKRIARRRRNPVRRKGMAGIVGQVMPAVTSAAGALSLDIIWARLPLPDQIKSGPMRFVAKAAGAIGLGMLAGMMVKKSTADQLATGALTVTIHQAMTDAMGRFAPNIPLGEYLSEYDSLGYYGTGIDPGMGEYLTNSGTYNPGSSLNAYDYETLTM